MKLANGGSNSSIGKWILTVDGGTFITGMKIHNDATTVVAGTSSAVILSNGGTLKLSADVADLLTTAGATVRFEMGTGGGTVHTNGFATTLNAGCLDRIARQRVSSAQGRLLNGVSCRFRPGEVRRVQPVEDECW